MNEASIKRGFRRKISTLGYTNIRLDYDGWPDWLIVGEGAVCGFVEFKAPGGKLSALQKRRIASLRGMMFFVEVVDCCEDDFVVEFARRLEEHDFHLKGPNIWREGVPDDKI